MCYTLITSYVKKEENVSHKQKEEQLKKWTNEHTDVTISRQGPEVASDPIISRVQMKQYVQ